MTFRREIQSTNLLMKRLPVESGADALAWLGEQAGAHGLRYLWAHADDGILWGRWDGARLVTGRDAVLGSADAARAEADKYFWAALREPALRCARAWSEAAELMLWRDDDGPWQARLLRDSEANAEAEGEAREYFDEAQLLWGEHAFELAHGFTLWTDGQEKMPHALPLSPAGATAQRLVVRHYLSRGSDPDARVTLSRLLGWAAPIQPDEPAAR
jgi:CRISPR-associated protein (TIGR03984 family)